METWDSGLAYERYVGRWSRMVAQEFLRWLALPHGLAWADIGCGTGALSSTILAVYDPVMVRGVDASEGFLSQAIKNIHDPRAGFEIGHAVSLPLESGAFDAAISGLMLNFVSDPLAAAREMTRVTKPGGCVAAYVWDYSAGMQMMRTFWDTAIAVDPDSAALDQAERFPLCSPGPLQDLLISAGLQYVAVRAIDIPTVFQDFDDLWNPLLERTGSAPAYLAGVSAEVRERIRQELQERLTPDADGRIALSARAWAVKGVVAA
ncbi:MAG TPA: methyltransferase domain-containing protein [Anaerolineaceae bacterium]